MANLALITSQAVPGNSGVKLMARVRGANGQLITFESFTSVAIVVTDLTLYNQGSLLSQQGTFSPAPAACIFDSLIQNDPAWSKDSLYFPSPPPPSGDGSFGYNFMYLVAAAMFVNSGHRFQVDAVLTPISGQPFRVPWQFGTQQVFG